MATKNTLAFSPQVIQDFSGGFNPKWAINATQLADNQSPKMVNADYASRFALTRRRGTTLIGDVNNTPGSTSSLMNFKKVDDTEILVKAYGTTVEYLAGNTTWTTLPSIGTLTANAKFGWVVGQNTLFFCNAVDSFFSWDGTNAVTAFAGNPKGNIFGVGFRQLFIAGDPAQPQRLYFSDINSYSNFATGAAGFIDFGSRIKSVIPFFDRNSVENFHVFLANGDLNEVTPNSSGALVTSKVRPGVGSLSHRATAHIENENFVCGLGGSVRTVGYENYISDVRAGVKSVLIDVFMQTLNMTNSCAVYNQPERLYYLAGQSPGALANDTLIIYDVTYDSWRVYSGIGANDMLMWNQSPGTSSVGLVCLACSTDCNVYSLDPAAYSDNGVPISFLYQTKDLDFGVPLCTKTMRWIKISGFISSGCKLMCNIYADTNLISPIYSKSISGNGRYVDKSVSYTWGGYAFGLEPFMATKTVGPRIPISPFFVVIPFDEDFHWKTIRIEFANEQPDVDFMVTQIKPFVSPDDELRYDDNEMLV